MACVVDFPSDKGYVDIIAYHGGTLYSGPVSISVKNHILATIQVDKGYVKRNVYVGKSQPGVYKFVSDIPIEICCVPVMSTSSLHKS